MSAGRQARWKSNLRRKLLIAAVRSGHHVVACFVEDDFCFASVEPFQDGALLPRFRHRPILTGGWTTRHCRVVWGP